MPLDFSTLGGAPRINTPFENLSQILQVRQQQESARALADQRRALAEEQRQKTDDLRQRQSDIAAIDAATAAGGTPEEQLARMPGHLRATIAKQFQESDEWHRKSLEAKQAAEKAEIEYAAHGAAKIKTWEKYGPDAMMNAAQAFLQKAKRDGHDVDDLAQAIQQDPSSLNARLDAVIAMARGPQAKPEKLAPGEGVLNAQGGYDVPIPKAPTGSERSPIYKEWQDVNADRKSRGMPEISLEQYQNEDANRKQRAQQERAPYFTYQTTFDPQGRPTGAIRFDARGGPPVNVDISSMTGGSQLKPPPGTTGAQAVANEVSTDQLDRLHKMFNDGAAAFIGPAEGRARSIGQQIPGVPVNTVFSDFKAASDAFKNSVIKAITGAQMSEAEATRIRGQIPEVTDKPAVWLSKAKQTRANLADLSKVLAKKQTTAPAAPPANETPEQRMKRLLGGG